MSVKVDEAMSPVTHIYLHNGHSAVEHADGLIKDADVAIFQWVMLTVVCLSINIFGMGTNIVNMVCFVKQGFKDSINVSLFGLAISDFGCLATIIWGNICFTPGFMTADLSFIPTEVTFLTSGIPHTTFAGISGWITALITLERCLCITAPLKVNAILTPKRVAIIVGFTFVVLIIGVSPVYVGISLGPKPVPHTNKTLIGFIYNENRESIEKFTYAFNNSLVPFGAFAVIITCTIILVVQLHKKIKWRRQTINNEQGTNVSNRNQKAAKMVLVISGVFIFCFIPVSASFTVMSVEPRLSIYGTYRNILTVTMGTGIVLESISSSVNIFIYYHMSTKYRIVVRKMFSLDKKKY